MNETSSWIERLARLGYVSKAAVYSIVGLLAVGAAVGKGGRAGDSHEALGVIIKQPFGRFLMIVVALGLLGYAVWRVISAVKDTEHRGSDAKGFAIRAGSFFRGLVYGGLTLEAFRLVSRSGERGRGSDAAARHWTGELMDKPFGRWLAIAAGLGIIGYAIFQFANAWRAKLSSKLRVGPMPGSSRSKVIAISRFGIAARAVVFALIGWSIAKAALDRDASAAQGTHGAIATIRDFGDWSLGVIGVGLIAYGVYQLLNARYRIIEAD